VSLKNKNLKVTGVIIVIFITLLIFWFSSKSGSVSMGQSDEILLKLNLITQSDINSQASHYLRWRFILRKGAHFIIFLILGTGIALVMDEDTVKIIILIILLAVLDEVHQTFTGRGASLSDVILDVAGGFTGWAIVESVRCFFKNNKKEGEG